MQIVEELERRGDEKGIDSREALLDELADVVADMLRPEADPQRLEAQQIDVSGDPAVLLVVGVNGTGKTTTIGKIAYRLKQLGKSR